jgi:hypothetical protein
MRRSLRAITLASISLVAIAAAPSRLLACGGGPMSFTDVVKMSPVILVAHVGQRRGHVETFLVERVLKGPDIPIELVPSDQLPVKVRVSDRVVLALMHPGISDGSGVTVWVIRPGGRLTDAGVSDEPKTFGALIARFEAPATSTAVSLDPETGARTGPAVGMLVPGFAGLLGGVLAWHRYGRRRADSMIRTADPVSP